MPRCTLSPTAAAAIAVIGLGFAAAAADRSVGIQPPPPPELTATVNDFAGVLDAAAKTALEDLSARLRTATGDVLIVATVKTRRPFASIDAYAAEMFKNRGRGIGERARDNGLLLVLAVEDREVRIEVGLGLETFVPDSFAAQIVGETMIPMFKKGDLGGGLLAGARRLAQRLADARGKPFGLASPSRPHQ
jgi:uncharacterized protein